MHYVRGRLFVCLFFFSNFRIACCEICEQKKKTFLMLHSLSDILIPLEAHLINKIDDILNNFSDSFLIRAYMMKNKNHLVHTNKDCGEIFFIVKRFINCRKIH